MKSTHFAPKLAKRLTCSVLMLALQACGGGGSGAPADNNTNSATSNNSSSNTATSTNTASNNNNNTNNNNTNNDNIVTTPPAAPTPPPASPPPAAAKIVAISQGAYQPIINIVSHSDPDFFPAFQDTVIVRADGSGEILRQNYLATCPAPRPAGHCDYVKQGDPVTLKSLPASLRQVVMSAFDGGVALTQSGDVYAWGAPSLIGDTGGVLQMSGYGQDKDIHTDPVKITPFEIEGTSTPTKYAKASHMVSVAEGAKTVVAVSEQKQVFSWGYNRNGQLGIGSDNPGFFNLQFIDSLVNIVSVFSVTTQPQLINRFEPEDAAFYAVDIEGQVYSWGVGKGLLGRGILSDVGMVLEDAQSKPLLIPHLSNVKSMSSFRRSSIYNSKTDVGTEVYALTQDGKVYSWISSNFMATPDEPYSNISQADVTPHLLNIPSTVAEIGKGLALLLDGSVLNLADGSYQTLSGLPRISHLSGDYLIAENGQVFRFSSVIQPETLSRSFITTEVTLP